MLGQPETRIAGRYRLVRLLGKGGMGAVWVARDEELGRDVAVKEVILPAEVEESRKAEIFERMMREARAAARLSHPNIVSVHDVVFEEGRPWIVMELLHGRTLHDAVKRGEPLAPERVARLGEELLGALTVAHEQGIQHRDVKPGNVFLCDDGRTMLTDFGIARVEGQVTITRSGVLVGSPGYMAPERLRGERGGPRSDLWSLGATLYAAVEGAPPFRGESPIVVLHRVLTQEAPPPRRAGAVLGAVLLHMLAREPDDRPDAATAGRWLREAAAGVPVRMPPPSARSSVQPVPSPPSVPSVSGSAGTATVGRSGGDVRGRAVAVVAGVAGIAVVAGLAWYGTARNDQARPAVAVASAQPSSAPSSPVASPPPPAASAQVTPTQERGRFTLPVDFCTLLTDAQAKAVAPGRTVRKGTSGDGCAWTVEGAGFSLSPLKPTEADEYWEAIQAEAHETLLNRKNARAEPSEGLWRWSDIGMGELMRTANVAARKVNGIGEEAFAYDVRNRDTGTPVRSVVVFRVSNLTVEAEYANLLPGQSGRIHDTALDLARAAAGELAGGG